MTKTARPGRPAQDKAQDACESIVDSACLHFAQQGIKGSSNREIAAHAKVTAAMVHYYFKRKEQLHEAVLHKMFDPLLEAVKEVATLEEWVHAFHAHLATRPWLPHLMIREVLTHNGGLRALFLRSFAPPLFGSIKHMVSEEIKGAHTARTLDIDRHVVLLMGMLVYPFLALGLAQNITGRKFDNTMFEGFRDDALALFRNGIEA